LKPVDGNGRGERRSLKRRKLSPESEDEFGIDDAAEAAMMEIGTLRRCWFRSHTNASQMRMILSFQIIPTTNLYQQSVKGNKLKQSLNRPLH
jgi:hypothetical protein